MNARIYQPAAPVLSRRQRGMTLVELMIGLVIGLVMTGAVAFLFIDATRNYRVNENLARIQESARFAVDKIGRSVRPAGYFGCAGEVTSLDNMLKNASNYLYDFGTAVTAFVAPSTGWPSTMTGFNAPLVGNDFSPTAAGVAVTPIGGSHILTLRGQVEGDIIVQSQPGGASIKFTNTNAITAGDILLVTTCKNSAIFQVTQVQPPGSANDFTNVVHNTGGTWVPGNATNKTDENLTGGEVMRIATTTYFIAQHPVHGRRSLFRHVGNANNAIEIAKNVTNMQIEGGIDNDGDRQVDSFLGAASITGADWGKVRAIRIRLTLESEDSGLTPEGNRLTYTTTTTIALRNRLP